MPKNARTKRKVKDDYIYYDDQSEHPQSKRPEPLTAENLARHSLYLDNLSDTNAINKLLNDNISLPEKQKLIHEKADIINTLYDNGLSLKHISTIFHKINSSGLDTYLSILKLYIPIINDISQHVSLPLITHLLQYSSTDFPYKIKILHLHFKKSELPVEQKFTTDFIRQHYQEHKDFVELHPIYQSPHSNISLETRTQNFADFMTLIFNVPKLHITLTTEPGKATPQLKATRSLSIEDIEFIADQPPSPEELSAIGEIANDLKGSVAHLED